MKRIALLFVLASLISAPAVAEKREIWHGWAAMPGFPCTKFETYRDSFGFTWPKVPPITAPQEHHTRIYLDAPNLSEIESIARDCALLAAGTSGATAFYLSPASAWPAFKAAFAACTVGKGKSIAENLLTVKAGFECRW